ncbi:siderophore-interacting protein [Marinobacter sp. BGYM27]|uniref:siderophore-interacting protein n=1 Tax=Marinobacter sp. BGYM27 TaxID=2975597 RepID=UPI0021A5C970|nr:siderophore-interacting protein [Marinobacter sp. BGYM27]MDG5499503.1 siderophore-interacting protein [Marinobacter sp. BGYM27]
MAKPAPRELDVIRSAYVTPHMLRVTLGGENITTLPEGQASAYVKLIFPQPAEARPLMRTYTIRHQRKDEIDIDFMIHDEAGPASGWAQTTRPGDRILVGGPGARKLINPDADWFVLAGDMTALPAISVNIELLPENARGYAVIEVLDERDIQDLPKPAGFDIHWVVNPKPDSSRSVILERLQQLPRLEGEPSVWIACEFSNMRQLRHEFKQERETPKSHLYISSYWKMGSSEDQHKLAKREDAEQTPA